MIGLEVALYLAAATLIAAIVRLYDVPKTEMFVDGKVDWGVVLPIVAGAAIAVPLGAWILGLDVLIIEGFVGAVAVGVAGMAFVKALLAGIGAE